MSWKSEARDIISSYENNLYSAVEEIYDRKKLAKDVLLYAVKLLRKTKRAEVRRQLRGTVIRDEFIKNPNGVACSVIRTKQQRRRLLEHTRGLFMDYFVGGACLGLATKEHLLDEAKKERLSGKGHVRNAIFLERLAEPLKSGQKVPDYWESEKAVNLIRKEIWDTSEDKQVDLVAA